MILNAIYYYNYITLQKIYVNQYYISWRYNVTIFSITELEGIYCREFIVVSLIKTLKN